MNATKILMPLALLIPACLMAQTSPASASSSGGAREGSDLDPAALRADINKALVKLDAMEEQQETSGGKGLKLMGYTDPSYIVNRKAKRASFSYLNFNSSSFSGANYTPNVPGGAFTYDNDWMGDILLRLEKQTESGTKFTLELMPHKGMGELFNFPSIINQAYMSMPLTDKQTRLLVGQMVTWPGYEYQQQVNFDGPAPVYKKTITGNLMIDFDEIAYMTGIGIDLVGGYDWRFRGAIGNANSPRNVTYPTGNQRSPVIHFRFDRYLSEFFGYGVTGMHGNMPNNNVFVTQGAFRTDRFDQLQADMYYVKGNVTILGQVDLSRQRRAAYNGLDTLSKGFSGLFAYKLTNALEGVLRYDYLNNAKNGGGGTNLFISDGANGFGPGRDASGNVIDPNRGANRQALTAAVNYTFSNDVTFKFESRLDRADLPVFYDVRSGTYGKSNVVLGASAVYRF